MKLTDEEKRAFLDGLERLTARQLKAVQGTVEAYGAPRRFTRNPNSDLVSEAVLELLGDQLIMHHAQSRQALSKDKFEFALEAALNAAGISAELTVSRTHRGHDITIDGTRFNLKTEAAAGIKTDVLHVSKWMELGKGEWELVTQRDNFIAHLSGYDRILTFRRIESKPTCTTYELVEIPKDLLLESSSGEIEISQNSKQSSTPGYVRVVDEQGTKFELYFDAGSERKLQVKKIRKDLCVVHGTWSFGPGCA